jgi:hypothetical protein
MRNRLLFLFVALMGMLVSWSAVAEPTSSEWRVDCGGTFDLCGYKDPATGKFVVPRRFELAAGFSEGLAGVRINRRFGFIDERGNVVIAPIYEMVGPFQNGLAEVRVRGKNGVIDRNGLIVVEPQFGRIIPVSKDLMFATEPGNYWEVRNFLLGMTTAPARQFSPPWKYGIYSVGKGWIRRPFLSDFAFLNDPDSGLFWAKPVDENLFGLLRADGTWHTKPTYSHVKAKQYDLAEVCQLQEIPLSLSCGAIDRRGVLVAPLRKNFRLSPWAGYGTVETDGKAGLIDYRGRLIGGRMFDRIDFPDSGNIAGVWYDGRRHGLDQRGHILDDPENGKVELACPNGVKFVNRSGGTIAIDASGRQISPHLFFYFWPRDGGCAFPIPATVSGKSTYVKPDGQLLLASSPFDRAEPFDGDFARVMVGDKWGLIDRSGRYTAPPQYDRIYASEGLFAVTRGDTRHWIDGHGNKRPAPFGKARRDDVLSCGNDGAKIFARAVDGKRLWGIADRDGRTIIEPRYRAITCFERGVAWVTHDRRKQWCTILPDGKMRVPEQCREENYLKFAHEYQQFSPDAYENSVLWTLAMLEFGIGERAEPPDSEIVE